MIQEDKELLLKDLCARLPYGVKVHAKYTDQTTEVDSIVKMIDDDGDVGIEVTCDTGLAWTYIQIDNVKPYLFPLSSMTEEQLDYNPIGFSQMLTIKANRDWENITINSGAYYKLVDWLLKNHFDYRGLIPKGLAIDATGLNIY